MEDRMTNDPNDALAAQIFRKAPRRETAQMESAFQPHYAVAWRPEPSNIPQCQAYDSAADLLLYGGAAGGGKSELLLGLALTRHRQSVIFRRCHADLAATRRRL